MTSDLLTPVSLPPILETDEGRQDPLQRVTPPEAARRTPGEEDASSQRSGAARADGSAASGAGTEAADEKVRELIQERMLELETSDLIRHVRFRFEVENDQILVKVIDSETDKVLRTVPPEEQVELARRLDEYLGVVFDETA